MNLKLSEMFDIPEDRLVIFLRHEHVYNHSVRTELYNIEWRWPKSIEEASGRLDHGTILYVEEADPKQQFDTFKWNIEFTKEQDRLNLIFNDPINDPNADVFSFKLEMSKQDTLLDLKKRVGE